jgi:hypothetical protein
MSAALSFEPKSLQCFTAGGTVALSRPESHSRTSSRNMEAFGERLSLPASSSSSRTVVAPASGSERKRRLKKMTSVEFQPLNFKFSSSNFNLQEFQFQDFQDFFKRVSKHSRRCLGIRPVIRLRQWDPALDLSPLDGQPTGDLSLCPTSLNFTKRTQFQFGTPGLALAEMLCAPPPDFAAWMSIG